MPGPNGPTGPTPTLPNGTGGTQLGDGNVGEPLMVRQGASVDITVATVLTAAQLITGLINYTGAGANVTLPTAALLDAAVPSAGVDNAIDFSITATTGVATLVLGAGMTAGTGARLTTAAATVSRYRLRRTADSAWTLYLIG